MTEQPTADSAYPDVPQTRIFSRQTLLLALLLAELVPLAIWSVLLCHEILGHLFTAVLFGGTMRGVHISLTGTATAFYSLPHGKSQLASILVSLSGTSVTLLLGILAAVVSQRIKKHPVAAFFCILFGICGVMSAMNYATYGLTLGFGDFAFVDEDGYHAFRAVVLFLIPGIAFGAFLLMRAYAHVQMRWFPTATPQDRLLLVACTLLLAFALFAVAVPVASVIHSIAVRTSSSLVGTAPPQDIRTLFGRPSLRIACACVLMAVGSGLLGVRYARNVPPANGKPITLSTLIWPAIPATAFIALVLWTGGDYRVAGPDVYRGTKQEVALRSDFELLDLEPDGRGRVCFITETSIESYDPQSGAIAPIATGLSDPMRLQRAGDRLYFVEQDDLSCVDLDTGDVTPVLKGHVFSAYGATESGDVFFADWGCGNILVLRNGASEPEPFVDLPEDARPVRAVVPFGADGLLVVGRRCLLRVSMDGRRISEIPSDLAHLWKLRALSKDRAIALDRQGRRVMLLELGPAPKEYELINAPVDCGISGLGIWDETTILYAGAPYRLSTREKPWTFLQLLRIGPPSFDRS